VKDIAYLRSFFILGPVEEHQPTRLKQIGRISLFQYII